MTVLPRFTFAWVRAWRGIWVVILKNVSLWLPSSHLPAPSLCQIWALLIRFAATFLTVLYRAVYV